MIETSLAQNGSPVLRYDGRLLSSAIDPQMEARQWRLRRATFLGQVKIIFVLGAGSGYHLLELLNNTSASLVVVEQSEEVIESVLAIHTFDSQRVHFENVQKATQLRTSVHVKSGVAQSFLVLPHPPSTACAPELYRECQDQLLGRDWGSLNWQWRLKGFAPLESQPKICAEAEQLTIYDLEQTELVRDSSERERMLVKALRELVK